MYTLLSLDVTIEALKANIDFSLRDANLRLSHEERILRLQAMQELAKEARRAMKEAKRKQNKNTI